MSGRLALAAVLLASAAARADDGVAPHRTGRVALGVGLGLGAMKFTFGPLAEDVAGELDVHLGGMLTPRLALLIEVQDDTQPHFSYCGPGDVEWAQWAAMVVGRYWIAPRWWAEGGLGAAHWTGGFDAQCASRLTLTGAALTGAIGYDLHATRAFAVDLRLRVIDGAYGVRDQITSATIGVGLDWY